MVEKVDRTVRSFVQQVGIQRLMEQQNVKPRMVRHVVAKGVMPAKWYKGAVEAAKEAKVAPPDIDLFDFDPKTKA